jgi:hypothetical protein
MVTIVIVSTVFSEASPFASWAFTRSTELCDQLSTPIGCTVVEERHVASNGFLTYCERKLGGSGTGRLVQVGG